MTKRNDDTSIRLPTVRVVHRTSAGTFCPKEADHDYKPMRDYPVPEEADGIDNSERGMLVCSKCGQLVDQAWL